MTLKKNTVCISKRSGYTYKVEKDIDFETLGQPELVPLVRYEGKQKLVLSVDAKTLGKDFIIHFSPRATIYCGVTSDKWNNNNIWTKHNEG